MAARMHPDSLSFTLFLGLLAALPTFGIDMILPTLPAMADALGARPSDVGLAMSAYLLGLGAALLVLGPASDRFGRKPIIILGCAVLIVASFGCMLAPSFAVLLLFRALQGAGASGAGVAGITIVSDLFEGAAARAKMSYIVSAINIVPMVAPTIGAALLSVGNWRTIYLVPIAGASTVLLAVLGFAESARIEANGRLRPAAVIRDYARVLRQRVCLGHILCNAAANGAVFAYITGSSLFFIDVLDFTPLQYGLVFGASSLSVIVGALANRHLGAAGVSSSRLITIGLVLCAAAAASLLGMALLNATSVAGVVGVMISVALSFGLISPNAMEGALRPMPEIAGSVSAVALFVQTVAAASSSALVTAWFDGRSAQSMASTMFMFTAFAVASYIGIVRNGTDRSEPQTRSGRPYMSPTITEQSWSRHHD